MAAESSKSTTSVDVSLVSRIERHNDRVPRVRLNSLRATANTNPSITKATASTTKFGVRFPSSCGSRRASMPWLNASTAPPANNMSATMKPQK